MNKREAINKFTDFVKGLKKRDRIALIHDSDADGVCAALLAAKALKKLTGRNPVLMPHYHSMESIDARELKKIKGLKANKIIVLDLPVDLYTESLRKLESIAERILVLDHHEVGKVKSNKTSVIKSNFIPGIPSGKYCTAKLCFDLFTEAGIDLSKDAWIACLGIVADVGDDYWRNFLKREFKRKGMGLKKGMQACLEITKIVDAVNFIEPRKSGKLFNALLKAKTFKDAMKKEFLELKKVQEKEFNKWLKKFRKEADYFPEKNLYFYVLKPRFSIKSTLTTSIARKARGKTFILVEDLGKKHCFISLRSTAPDINTPKLFRKATKGFAEASGGGHPVASGGRILCKDIQRFKENLVKAHPKTHV